MRIGIPRELKPREGRVGLIPAACVELVRVAAGREASLGVRLLADLRRVFGEAEALSTEVILERLHDLTEAPWSDLRGKPLDPRGLARRLRGYEIASGKVKVAGKALQGYRREHLWDAWTRYLPSTPESPEPPEPPEQPLSEAPSEVPEAELVPEPHPHAEPSNRRLTRRVPQVPEVPPFQRERTECTVCGRRMTLVEVGQSTHPGCAA